MAIHDAFARRTPYEVAIPGRTFTRDHFPRIRDEAAAGQADTRDPARFVFLGAVGHAIDAIAGEERRGAEEDPYGEIRRHGPILFHAFHFWSGGETLLLLSTGAARSLVSWDAEAGAEAWTEVPAPPADSGYLQLPRNLFWGEAVEGGAVEPLDGLFWTCGADGVVHVLAVLGLRDDRPGVSVVDLPGITPPVFLDAVGQPAREKGTDFESDLPGAELEGLYSVKTGAELVKLLGRAFALLHRRPELLGAVEHPPAEHPSPEEASEEASEEGAAAEGGEAPPSATGPRPSALPFRRVLATDSGSAAAGAASGPGEGPPGDG